MASTSASTVSVQKPSTSCSEETTSSKRDVSRRKSTDTVCSSNSSCFMQKRKTPHPFTNASVKVYAAKDTARGNSNTAVRQRVLSARLLKLRSVQSQLNDANFHLAELVKENRALKTLQKRQDRALLNYEGVNAELPRLIKSHEDEIRMLRERNKTLRRGLREAAEHLKMKEDELQHVREQLKRLTALSKDKHLGERGKLADELEDVKMKLNRSETQINLLNRKLMLETKNYKFRVNVEIAKNKETQKQLAQAIAEIGRLAGLLEGKNRPVLTHNNARKVAGANGSTKRQSMSLISLAGNKTATEPDEMGSETRASSSVGRLRNNGSDVKLEPIVANSDSKRPPVDAKPAVEADDVDEAAEKLHAIELNGDAFDGPEDRSHGTQKSVYTLPMDEELMEDAVLERRLGDYCSKALATVNVFNAIGERHQEQYETSRSETEKLMRATGKTDEMQSRLRHRNTTDDRIALPANDVDIINQILDDEIDFRKNNNSRPSRASRPTRDTNGNVTFGGNDERAVSLESKRKLLATLKAIDNGESLEEKADANDKRTQIMNELFGGNL